MDVKICRNCKIEFVLEDGCNPNFCSIFCSNNFIEFSSSVTTLDLFKINDVWCFFDKNGIRRQMIPAGIHQMSLPPHFLGVNTLLEKGIEINKITSDQISLQFSVEEFVDYDAKLEWSQKAFGGDVYKVIENDDKMKNTFVWLCSTMGIYYLNAPKHIFVRLF